jgi:hypothetical protein
MTDSVVFKRQYSSAVYSLWGYCDQHAYTVKPKEVTIQTKKMWPFKTDDLLRCSIDMNFFTTGQEEVTA